MKLTELKPQFLRHEVRIEPGRRVKAGADPLNYTEDDIEEYQGPHDWFIPVETLADAHGMHFLCPLCFAKNGGSRGTHMVSVGFAGRAHEAPFCHDGQGKLVFWNVSGAGFADLTLTPSIQCLGGCNWHGFVTNGEVT